MPVGRVLWGVKLIYYVFEPESKKEYKCTIKGKVIETDFNIKNRSEVNPIVVGDLVEFEIVSDNEGVITKRLKRKSEYKRLKNNGREIQTLAANIDTIVIVDSIENPPLRPFFIDRCLFTADYMKIEPLIVINKIDLLDDSSEIKEIYRMTKEAYLSLGYEIIETSILEKDSIEILKSRLKDKISSFTGRSGVGKSSLIKIIDPSLKDIKIGDISKKYNRGSHTTTFARMYPLNFGGMIIDTPGIRELAVYIDKPEDVCRYFRDFNKFKEKCRYPDCQHIDEPECSVIDALKKGKIYDFRYESYLRIRKTVQKVVDSRIF